MNRGFTLIEVLVASSILIVLGLGVVGLQFIISSSQLSAINNYVNVDQANAAVTRISRELRKIQPSENGAYPLELADDNEIIFYSDVDYDGVAERVHYTLTGKQLTKGVTEPTGTPAEYLSENETVIPLADNINNYGEPFFSYYNDAWPGDLSTNPLPDYLRLSDTRLIRIYIDLNSNPNLKNQDYILESNVNLRVLKSNY
jgi:prepilin-type N-terminal cleavage/methylation domain-containing protein